MERKRILYEMDYMGDFRQIEFIKMTAPPYSHKVIAKRLNLNGPTMTIGWLHRDFNPSLKQAKYFYEKHMGAHNVVSEDV